MTPPRIRSKKPKEVATRGRALAVRKAGQVASNASSKRAEILLDLIARRKQTIAENFYDIGEALRELLKKKLYLPIGYKTFGDMLEGRSIMGRTQAAKLIEVVSTLPRDKALALGSEKAYALARLAAATPEVDNAATLLATGVGKTKRAVGEMSVRDINAATKKAHVRSPLAKKNPERVVAERQARVTQTALRGNGAKGATVTAVKGAKGFALRIVIAVEDAEVLIR